MRGRQVDLRANKPTSKLLDTLEGKRVALQESAALSQKALLVTVARAGPKLSQLLR
jgi:hypothetical protein